MRGVLGASWIRRGRRLGPARIQRQRPRLDGQAQAFRVAREVVEEGDRQRQLHDFAVVEDPARPREVLGGDAVHVARELISIADGEPLRFVEAVERGVVEPRRALSLRDPVIRAAPRHVRGHVRTSLICAIRRPIAAFMPVGSVPR